LSRSRLASLLLLALTAARAEARVQLEVSGSATTEDEDLVVSVQVDNRGTTAATTVVVHGELLGHHDEVQKDAGIAAGSWTEAQLRFPHDVPRPGVHVVWLRIEHKVHEKGVWAGQAAYLLVALGANPPPAVRVFAGEVTIDTRGGLPVELESADGRPHVARLRLLTPKGINPFGETADVHVPAQGRVSVTLEMLRGSASRGSRYGVLAAASTMDGPEQTSAVAQGVVSIAPDPAVMPRLRTPLTVLAIGLLLVATVVELRRRWPRADAG
jgi:hypothetical protein